MISRTKFLKLKKITKYFRIADELKALRDAALSGDHFSTEKLGTYILFLKESGEAELVRELEEILSEKNERRLIEKSHFLLLKIREMFGYPSGDNAIEVLKYDKDKPVSQKTDLVVILENIRSAFNAGSVIRTCECFGVKRLYLGGITPGIENPKTLKTSKSAENNLEVVRTGSVSGTISELKAAGYEIIGAETCGSAKEISEFEPSARTVIIFGNEELGITHETLRLCDHIVSIRMRGIKNSLNVSSAAAVFIYEFTKIS